MITLHLVFIIIAILLFCAASFGVSSRIHLGWLGMGVLAAALIVGG